MRFYLKGKDRLRQLVELKRLEQPNKYYRYTAHADEYGKSVSCSDPEHCYELLAADPTMSFDDDLFYLRVDREAHMRGWEDEDES